MNGYQTLIFEKNKIPGGLVTAWRRKGYLIDLCIHWLAGSGPGIHLHRYWNEIGLLEGRQFIQEDRYAVFRGKDGRTFNLYSNPERLEQHMLELSPQDAPAIHEFIEGLRLGIRFNPPQKERYEASALGWMKYVLGLMPILGKMQKWQKLTLGEVASRFSDPLLRLGDEQDADAGLLRLICIHQPGIHGEETGWLSAWRLAAAVDLSWRNAISNSADRSVPHRSEEDPGRK